MSSNAAVLYERIQNDPEHTKALFRQALQDPQGALKAICDLGHSMGLPVTPDEVKAELMRRIEETGVTYYIFAGTSTETRDLFAKEVMPAFNF